MRYIFFPAIARGIDWAKLKDSSINENAKANIKTPLPIPFLKQLTLW